MLDQMDFVYQSMLEDGVIDRHALDRASQHAADHRVSVTEALVLQGAATRQSITIARALVSSCAYVDLARYELDASRLGSLLPRAICEKNQAFPLFFVGNRVTVGMADPTDLPAIDRVRRALGREIDAVICEPRALRDLIARAHAASSEPLEKPEPAPQSREPRAAIEPTAATPPQPAPAAPIDAKEPAAKPTRARQHLSAPASPATIVTIDQLLASAADDGASEIHLHADERGMRARARIDGRMTDRPGEIAPKTGLDRLGVLAGQPLALDGVRSRSFAFAGIEATIRAASIAGGWTATISLRANAAERSLSELGYSAETMTRVGAMLASPPGIVLFAGGFGSGRTTALHASLRALDGSGLNIIAACEHAPAGLRNFGPGGASAAAAFRPDVLLIDPIQGEHDARAAIQAALEGALVLGAISAPGSADAAVRLRELSGWTDSASSMLRGVLGLRLVRKVCGACARVEPPSASQRRILGLADHETSFVRGSGCPKCRGAGTRGLAPVFELLEVNAEIASLIASGVDARTIHARAIDSGMSAMWRHGLDMARLGVTSLLELEPLAPELAPAPLALRRSA